MDDLVQWLTEVWDEEEALAKKAGGGVGEAYIDGYGHLNVPRHQVLARIAADRKILAELQSGDLAYEERLGVRIALCHIASAYKDRPGYQESWAVQ